MRSRCKLSLIRVELQAMIVTVLKIGLRHVAKKDECAHVKIDFASLDDFKITHAIGQPKG